MSKTLNSVLLNQPVRPNLDKVNYYLDIVNTNAWFTNFGPLHQEFTKRLEDYLGVENLLLVSNGTLALQVAAKVLNVNNVITTPFSFIATTSAMLWQNTKVNFCDIDKKNYNLSANKVNQALESDDSIDGILATHVYGNPCDIHEFERIRNARGMKLIYDAAHAFGVKTHGDSILKYGDASTLSFHATKVFHSIEGGAIVFKYRDDYEKAKALINFGIGDNGEIIGVGINAKMNEYQCAVGLTLLDNVDDVLAHRSLLFNLYRDELKGFVGYPIWDENSTTNGAYMPILLDEAQYGKVVDGLNKNCIQFRPYFTPSLDTIFSNENSFGCHYSHLISGRVICLPLHYYLSENDVKRVCSVIREVL